MSYTTMLPTLKQGLEEQGFTVTNSPFIATIPTKGTGYCLIQELEHITDGTKAIIIEMRNCEGRTELILIEENQLSYGFDGLLAFTRQFSEQKKGH